MEHEYRLTALEARVSNLEAQTQQSGRDVRQADAVEMAWRGDLEIWKSDLVVGLSVAAAELSKLQEEVDALEDHVLSLNRSAAGMANGTLTSAAEGNGPAGEGQPSLKALSQIVSRMSRMESAMVVEIQPMKEDLLDLKTNQSSWMEAGSARWHEASSQNKALAADIHAVQSKHDSWVHEVAARWQETSVRIAALAAEIEDVQTKQKDTTRKFRVASPRHPTVPEDVKTLMCVITEVGAKLDSKVDACTWRDVNVDFDAHLKTLRDIACDARCEFESWRKQCDERFALHYRDIRKLLVRAQFGSDD